MHTATINAALMATAALSQVTAIEPQRETFRCSPPSHSGITFTDDANDIAANAGHNGGLICVSEKEEGPIKHNALAAALECPSRYSKKIGRVVMASHSEEIFQDSLELFKQAGCKVTATGKPRKPDMFPKTENRERYRGR